MYSGHLLQVRYSMSSWVLAAINLSIERLARSDDLRAFLLDGTMH